MIKLKRKKKQINESKTTVKYDANITVNDINDLFGQLMSLKEIDIRKLYANNTLMQNTIRRIPLSKVNVPIKVKMKDENGERELEFIPGQLAALVDKLIVDAMHNPYLNVILSYIDKPIIWSFDLETAASDGIRVAFNPAFAYTLLEQGLNALKDLLTKEQISGSNKSLLRSKYIIFILCHEIYHQIYRHREAAERKTETANGNNHFLANIAMDVEINRDLERQFPSIFNNVTEEIGGCFDTRFPSETWEPIFDAYYTGETPLPNTKKFNSQIKPAKVTKKDNSGSGGGSQKFPPDYVKGYEDAIQDVIDGKVDPLTYPINEPTSQYEEGYNAAIELIKKGKTEGIEVSDNSNNQGGQTNLPQIPWDMPNLSNNQQDNKLPEQESGQLSGKSDNNLNNQQGSQQGSLQSGQQSEQQSGQQGSQQGSQQSGQQNGQQSGQQNGQQGGQQSGQQDGLQGGQQGGQQDSQQSGQQSGQQGAQNLLPTDLSDKSDDYRKAYAEEIQKELDKSLGNDTIDIDTSNDTIELKEARELAKKDINDKIKELLSEISSEARQVISDEDIAKEYEGAEYETETSSKFGGDDMVNKKTLSKLAEDAGDPYTGDELSADPIEKAKKFNEDHKQQLNDLPGMELRLNDIEARLAVTLPLGDWKSKMRSHFRDAVEGDIKYTRSRRTMSQTWRADRYNPYKDVQTVRDEAANIFYLIDNSGSMYNNGTDIFIHIFAEIISLEKTCHVGMSARSYFTTYHITPETCETWTSKTPKAKILEKLAKTNGSGGTQIALSVLDVTKLRKPYYYQTPSKHTTIMVFTDGEEFGDWSELDQIPTKIKRDIVFVLVNDEYTLRKIMSQLSDRGIKKQNIIPIDKKLYL